MGDEEKRYGRRWVGELIVLLVSLSMPVGSAARADDLGRRDVLASGDVVPGFGVIGTGGFEVLGIDERGRLLIGAELGTGEEALLQADEAGSTVLWRTGEPQGTPLRPQRLDVRRSPSASPDGERVVTLALLDGPNGLSSNPYAVVELDPPSFRRIVELGTATPDGGVICGLGEPRINDAGTIAFVARVVPASGDCDDFDGAWIAIYLARAGSVSVEATTRNSDDELELRLLDLLENDSVVYVTSPDIGDAPEQVLVSRGGERRCLIGGGDPDDCPEQFGRVLDVSSNGEVLLRVVADGIERLFRTEDGALVPVAAAGDVLPGGAEILSVDDIGFLDRAGNAVLLTSWDEQGVGGRGIVLFPPTGPPSVVSRDGAPRGFNDAQQIAWHSSYPPPDRAERWTAGRVERLLSTGDTAAGGGVVAARGLEGSACLAADGRVAAIATASDYGQGVLCRDARATHLIARHGDRAPGGGRFVNFFDCAFGGESALLFLASVEDGGVSLYRAGPRGLERVIGPDDMVFEGQTVGDIGHSARFAVNASGVVLLAPTPPSGLFRRRPGVDPVEWVSLAPIVFRIDAFGITDDDTIVASARLLSPLRSALLVDDGNGARVAVTASDPRLVGGPFERIGYLLVSGQAVVFEAVDGADRASVFAYDLREDVVRPLLSRDPSRVFPRLLHGLTPAGRLLFEEALPETGGPGWPTATYLLDGGEIRSLFHRTALSDSVPVAINDRGNVHLRADRSPLGAPRNSVSLEGPEPEVPCPPARASGETSSHSNDGCQIDGGGESVGWMVLLAAAIVLARRNDLRRASREVALRGSIPALEPIRSPSSAARTSGSGC